MPHVALSEASTDSISSTRGFTRNLATANKVVKPVVEMVGAKQKFKEAK